MVNRTNSAPAVLHTKTTTFKATGNNEVVHLLNELKSFLYFLFSLLSLHYSYCRGRNTKIIKKKPKHHKKSHCRFCWQLSSIVFCMCLNLLLKKFQTRCPDHQSPYFIHPTDTGQQAAYYQASAFSHMALPGYMSKEELLQFELSTSAASK